MPHFQPELQLLGRQAPPPGPAGGQGPGPQSQSASPHHATGMPHAALALPAVRFAGREGAKRFGGGGPGPLWGLQLPTPCSLPHTFMPRSRGKRSDPTEMLEPGGTNSHVLLQNTARSPAEHPLGTEGGGTGPQGQYGALGGAQPGPGYPHHHQRKKEQGEEGCLVVSFSLLLTFLFGINTIWSPELRPFWLWTSFGISPPGRRRSTRTKGERKGVK